MRNECEKALPTTKNYIQWVMITVISLEMTLLECYNPEIR